MAQAGGWDTLIRGARVFDGTGAAPVFEDVALANGRIAARGARLSAARADRVVEAPGLWLMPGLLDIHTHFDLEVELAPGLPEAVRHGTTTVVVANCSLGLAFGNQRRAGQDPIVDCFARVENIPKAILAQVAERAVWRDSADYLAHLDTLPLGPNIVPLIPHSMLRIEVMGLADSVARAPDASELARMEALLDKAMAEGYAGFSTDALPFHYLANAPRQRRRIPAQYGSFAELKRLVDVVRRHDRLWQATPPKDNPLATARLFALTSGRLYGRPVRLTAVAALDVATNRTLAPLARLLARLLNSRLVDGRFRLQALAAPFKTWSEGAITPLAEEIPELRALNEPDLDDRAARAAIMDDPDWQRRFLAMWRHGKRGLTLARFKRLLAREDYAISRDLAHMVVDRAPVADWQGETLAAVFARFGRFRAGDAAAARSADERAAFDAVPTNARDDAAFLLHLLRAYDRDLVWWTVSANRDPGVVRDLLFNPRLLPGFNDSGAHLTNMAFYDGNLRALQIAQGEGEAQVARMVRRLTVEPAVFLGLEPAPIAVGARADLALIDPAALAAYDSEAQTRRVHRDVFDHEQLVNRSDGVVAGVWIAGQRAWDGTAVTPALGTDRMGRALRAANHRPPAPAALAAE
ncbi:N-acyl-D-glutamate deacylase [Rhodothalassium salexigens]|uniref:N-acyl-D-amino-acid deacylase family protein n=1 Tax=Rhodothalassium salexigens TaxID=1086 RepID=UPI0019135F8C|nr:hypothetical protein [Rhodothalassium salexigens]MBK5910609.1 N-acyl-D-glutamate deacylase [Rhodothalassium salexigens]